jgi:hypothetical protein
MNEENFSKRAGVGCNAFRVPLGRKADTRKELGGYMGEISGSLNDSLKDDKSRTQLRPDSFHSGSSERNAIRSYSQTMIR